MAQNIGAGKPERINAIFRSGIIINIPIIFIMSALCIVLPKEIMRVFIKDPEAIQIGTDYLKIVGAGYLFFTVFYVSNGIINGAGKTLPTMFFFVHLSLRYSCAICGVFIQNGT